MSSNSDVSLAPSIRSASGRTDSSHAITTTARNPRPLARCIVEIGKTPVETSMRFSRRLHGRPAFFAAAGSFIGSMAQSDDSKTYMSGMMVLSPSRTGLLAHLMLK